MLRTVASQGKLLLRGATPLPMDALWAHLGGSRSAYTGACLTYRWVFSRVHLKPLQALRVHCREHKAEGAEAGGTKGKGILYWLRQDFRLHDNPALSAAAQAAKKQASGIC